MTDAARLMRFHLVQPFLRHIRVTHRAARFVCLPRVRRVAHRAVVLDARFVCGFCVRVAGETRRHLRFVLRERMRGVAHRAICHLRFRRFIHDVAMAVHASRIVRRLPVVVGVAEVAGHMRRIGKLVRNVRMAHGAFNVKFPRMRLMAERTVRLYFFIRRITRFDLRRMAHRAIARHFGTPFVVGVAERAVLLRFNGCLVQNIAMARCTQVVVGTPFVVCVAERAIGFQLVFGRKSRRSHLVVTFAAVLACAHGVQRGFLLVG